MALQTKLSVIIPGYNEQDKIYENLIEIEVAISKITSDYELIFVDDGSNDDTYKNACLAQETSEKIKVIGYSENQGKGHAIKVGTAEATGDYVAFVDADLDLHPSQLVKFFDIMNAENADAVIGSKQHPDSELYYPKSRRMVSRCYSFLLFILFRLKVKDTQTGLKLFKKDAIKSVMQKTLVKRFAFDIEILALLHRDGCKIAEAPIKLDFQREESWGRIRIKDMFRAFWDTLAVFYRMYILKYYDKKDAGAKN